MSFEYKGCEWLKEQKRVVQIGLGLTFDCGVVGSGNFVDFSWMDENKSDPIRKNLLSPENVFSSNCNIIFVSSYEL